MKGPTILSAAVLLAVLPATTANGSGANPPPKKFITNFVGMKLVRIPAGEFLMGSPVAMVTLADELGPVARDIQHRVRITKPFYLGMHEVTVWQFRLFVDDTGYKTDAEKDGWRWNEFMGEFDFRDPKVNWRNPNFTQNDSHPVVNVSWNDAVAFCRWLSRKEGQTYRLPSEAEWEYACRAGTSTRFAFGGTLSSNTDANFTGQFTAKNRFNPFPTKRGPYLRQTAPVGSYRANAWGLFDMHGNVWEWCQDWYDEQYYVVSALDDPTGPTESIPGYGRVRRGGGWNGHSFCCQSTYRNYHLPDHRFHNLGFRVALVPAE